MFLRPKAELAKMNHQSRVTDLVPRRALPIVLGGLFGLALIAICLVLHHFLPRWAPSLAEPRLAAFDLESSGSVAVWLSTMMLAKAAAVCWLIYSVRKHHPDDYQGRYRVWLWMALLASVMSLSATANLHLAFQHVVTQLSGWSLNLKPAAIWLGSLGLVIMAVGARVVVDARKSRATSTLLIAAMSFWVAAAVAEMGWLPVNPEVSVLVRQGCKMMGQLSLLVGVTLYARFMVLDAEGLLPAKAAKTKAAKSSTPKIDKHEKTGASTRIDSGTKDAHSDKRTDLQPHAPIKPNGKPESKPQSKAADHDDDDYDDDGEDSEERKAGKAERKRMRRLKAEQRRSGL